MYRKDNTMYNVKCIVWNSRLAGDKILFVLDIYLSELDIYFAWTHLQIVLFKRDNTSFAIHIAVHETDNHSPMVFQNTFSGRKIVGLSIDNKFSDRTTICLQFTQAIA